MYKLKAPNLPVCIVTPDSSDACAFYRSVGPLAHLAQFSDLKFKVVTSSEVAWPTIMTSSLFLFQRPASDTDFEAFNLVKNSNRKIWLDFDDDLLNVPESNPAFPYYQTPEIRENVQSMLKDADAITVSTKPLQKSLPHAKDALHAPNSWDLDNFPLQKPKHAPEKKYLWRGSNTHIEDLLQNLPMFTKLRGELMFLNVMPWFIPQTEDLTVTYHPAVTILKYLALIKTYRPDMFVFPLSNTPFNEAKSNIAWLEATYCGATCLTNAHWDQWKTAHKLDWKASKEEIETSYNLKLTNKIRAELIESLAV